MVVGQVRSVVARLIDDHLIFTELSPFFVGQELFVVADGASVSSDAR